VNEVLDGWEAFKGLWGLVVTGVGVWTMRQIGRIDKLEETRVPKEDHQREVDHLRAEHQRNIERVEQSLTELRAETQAGFNRVFTRLDEIADRVKR
jgi:hypothetical protein